MDAKFIYEHFFHIHRGCRRIDGHTFAFGNDGIGKDQRSQRELALLRERAESKGIRLGRYSTHDATWALELIHDTAYEQVEAFVLATLWEGWFGKSLDALTPGERCFMVVQTSGHMA